jgi:hypothetical protein
VQFGRAVRLAMGKHSQVIPVFGKRF